jgi:predicted extracellular nuclease
MGPGPVVPPGGGDFNCPGEGLTICDIKYEESPDHPALSDPVALTGLLVTTPVMTVSENPEGMATLFGFYAQDQETLQGEYAGVLVVYGPDLMASAPTVGDIVDINGTFEMFGREGAEQQKQVKAASIAVTNRGTIAPLEVSSPSVVLEKAKAYEGVLLKLPEVAITNNLIMHNGTEIFNAFELENTLVVSGAMFRYSNPMVGEVFSSITGVLRLGTAPFDAGHYQLTPRFQVDVVPKNAAAVVTSIKDIQDITSPGHPTEGCRNVSGSTEGKCATARLTNVVVTAVDMYVSRNLRGFFVTDLSVADGRFAGVKVVYNPNSVNIIPERGMHVDIEGEIIDYFRGTQIQYATIAVSNTDMTMVEPRVVPVSEIARTSAPEMNPWEGQLVKIENVSVTTACLEDSQQRDHGNWVLNDTVYVGSGFEYAYNGDLRPQGTVCIDGEGNPTGLCACSMPPPNDLRMVGDTFTSITGVMDYAFNELQIQPREDADLVR